MPNEARASYLKCAWCSKDAIELFTFTWEETGDVDYICEECLTSIEDEFYVKGEDKCEG